MNRQELDLTALYRYKIEALTPLTATSPIHFSGANGIPVGVYQEFLNLFAETFTVQAVDCRATLPQYHPDPSFGLAEFADDLIAIIESSHSTPVIGMGHSFGALITLIAALKRPDLFNKLVLIDPASVPSRWIDLIYPHVPEKLLFKLVPMIAKTAQRKRHWQNHESFIKRYSDHPTYKRFPTKTMQAYASYGLREHPTKSLELVFAREWETHIFRQVEYVWKYLHRCELPCLFLKAEYSNLYSDSLFHSKSRDLSENFTGLVLPDTYHLMPLEKPKICFRAISDWLNADDIYS